MQGNERWRPLTGSNNPSARLRAARSMPQWLHARGSALPPPPPPPEEPAPDPDYEVIEFPGQAYSNAPLQHEVKMRGEGRRCDLCGSTAPAVQCAQCSQQNFCPSCDDMYHRHPKRQSHVRKALESRGSYRPPLPPKGEPAVAPVPPPRRNKRLMQPSSRPTTPTPLFDQGVPAKKDVGIVGSLKRMITGRPLPPPPMNRQMDRFGGMQPAQMGFQDQSRMMGREFGYPDWDMERGQRSGSMTALNMVPSGFSPMMQAHSMAQLNCPSCHHGMMWGGEWGGGGQMWGGQGWHGSGMLPPYRGEEHETMARRNSLRAPQQHRFRRRGGGSSSDDEDEEVMSSRGSRTRRAVRQESDFEDSDDERRVQPHLQQKRIPRRASLAEGINRRGRQDDDTMSVRGTSRRYNHETMTPRATRRVMDLEDTASSRGGRRRSDLEDSVSNRGGRRRSDLEDSASNRGGRRSSQLEDSASPRAIRTRSDLEETISNRGGRRRSDLEETSSSRGGRRRPDAEEILSARTVETVSNRGGRRYVEEVTTPRVAKRTETEPSRYNEEVMSNRGGRKSDLDESLSVRSGRREEVTLERVNSTASAKRNERFSDTGRRRRSPVDLRARKESPPKITSMSSEESVDDGVPNMVRPQAIKPEVEKFPSTQELNGGDKSPSFLPEDIDEEPEEELGPIPTTEWECQHCTFVNEPGTRVCLVCCKTTSRPKPQPSKPEPPPPPQKQPQPQPKAKQERFPEPVVVPQQKMDRVTESVKKISLGTSTTTSASTSPRPAKKKEGPTVVLERNKTVTSKGTSPPPQSISTQTYEVLGRKLKRATSLADHEWNQPPLRSQSRQSLLSDTQSLPVTPPRSRSPDTDSVSQLTESQADSQALSSIASRRISEPTTVSRSSRRAGSQPPDYISTLVQKQVKQGLEMVKLLREAEENQFTAEDLGVALSHCGDSDPVAWLVDNWRNMIDTVVTLATNYGHERKENIIGTISAVEAREALRQHNGNVWAAVTECVEQRQKKYGELLSRGNFTREDIVTSLTANHGNLEAAYVELSKSQLKPFLMRIWGPPQGADNDSAPPLRNRTDEKDDEVVGMAGRGGEKPDEVSVDDSNNTNNDKYLANSSTNNARVQSWLANYVQEPAAVSTSQKDLSVLGLANQVESIDNAIHATMQLSRVSAQQQKTMKEKRSRRYSDVQRYLTSCFYANSHSLQIGDRYQSMLNLSDGSGPTKLSSEDNLGPDRYTSYTNLSAQNVEEPPRRREPSPKPAEDNEEEAIKFTFRVPIKTEERTDQEWPEARPEEVVPVVEDQDKKKAGLENTEGNTTREEDAKGEKEIKPEEQTKQETESESSSSEEEDESSEEEASEKKSSEEEESSASFESVTSSSSSSSSSSSEESSDDEDVTQTVVDKNGDVVNTKNEIPKFFSAVNMIQNIPFIDNEDPPVIRPPSGFEDAKNDSSSSEETDSDEESESSEESEEDKKPEEEEKSESVPFEESMSYPEVVAPMEEPQPPPVDFSEDVSDKDISSIPLDSVREPAPPVAEEDVLTKRKMEIMNLLKESLSRDAVIDRIVSTLFASVIKESIKSDNESSTGSSERKKLEQSMSVVSTSSDQDPEFYEAKEEPEDLVMTKSELGREDSHLPSEHPLHHLPETKQITEESTPDIVDTVKHDALTSVIPLPTNDLPENTNEQDKVLSNESVSEKSESVEEHTSDEYIHNSQPEENIGPAAINQEKIDKIVPEEQSENLTNNFNNVENINQSNEAANDILLSVHPVEVSGSSQIKLDAIPESKPSTEMNKSDTEHTEKHTGDEPTVTDKTASEMITTNQIIVIEKLTEEKDMKQEGSQDVIQESEVRKDLAEDTSTNNEATNPTNVEKIPEVIKTAEVLKTEIVNDTNEHNSKYNDESKSNLTDVNETQSKIGVENVTVNGVHKDTSEVNDKITEVKKTTSDGEKEKSPPKVTLEKNDVKVEEENEKNKPKKTAGYQLPSKKPIVSKLPLLNKTKVSNGSPTVNKLKGTQPKKTETAGRGRTNTGDITLKRISLPGFSPISSVIKNIENKIEQDTGKPGANTRLKPVELKNKTSVPEKLKPIVRKEAGVQATTVKKIVQEKSKEGVPAKGNRQEESRKVEEASNSIEEVASSKSNTDEVNVEQKNLSTEKSTIDEGELRKAESLANSGRIDDEGELRKVESLANSKSGITQELAGTTEEVPKDSASKVEVPKEVADKADKVTNEATNKVEKVTKEESNKVEEVTNKESNKMGEAPKEIINKIEVPQEVTNKMEEVPKETTHKTEEVPKEETTETKEVSQKTEEPSVEEPGKIDQMSNSQQFEFEESSSKIEAETEFNFEREVRRCLAEGLVSTYSEAEVAVQLIELKFDKELSLVAARECPDIQAAITYLQQDCSLCAGKYAMTQMVDMLECEHRCCRDCAQAYYTLQISERNINDCVCPFCKKPNVLKMSEDDALNYFSNLDILLKGIVAEKIHELFQRKLRDRTLMQDPNFKWCPKCSSGFIANPEQKRLICPDCKAISCASCMKPWEKEHEGVSCEEYRKWHQENNDHENLLAKHLAEHGVVCPNCKNRYALAKGGCMHLTCPQCKHDFCVGCGKPFLMGDQCTVSAYCTKLGLHAHHPRNCLFYLRDKEPNLLQKLLDENGVDYKRSDEDYVATTRCLVQILKETAEGLVDAICGLPTENVGLCRTHYVEHLAKLICERKLDPVVIMDQNEAQQELRRRGKAPPTRDARHSDQKYLELCIKMVQEEIPLE